MNGFILSSQDDEDLIPNRQVYSFDIGEHECVVELLNCIKELLGYAGSKHDYKRIFVRLENKNGE